MIHPAALLIGPAAEATARCLQLRPALPDWLSEVRLKQWRVGQASVDLTVSRLEDGTHRLEVEHRHGKLEVVLENTT